MGKIKFNCEKKSYVADYVVVGVGLAGSVLCNLLSGDNKTSVIGIEAGNNNIYDNPIKISAFAGVEYNLTENYFPEYFWQQKPVPNGSLVNMNQATPNNSSFINCSLIPNNQSDTNAGDYTTGRILGGGSSINGQQYVRGTRGFYDQWSQIGGDIWSFENAVKNYIELEKYYGLTPNPCAHGYKGPMYIRQAPTNTTTIADDFVSAVTQATGLNRIHDDDYNDTNPNAYVGPFGRWELFQYPDGTRAGAAEDFLNNNVINNQGAGLDGRRLLILLKTTALNIIWDEKTARGVNVLSNGKFYKVYAKKEVIVCLGIHSSEFLQRSGVGPANLLKCLKIPVVYNNPNVGNGFTNQTFVTAVFNSPEIPAVPLNDPNALYAGGAFLPTLISQDDPNLRGYQLIGGSSGPGNFSILVIHLQPHSEGAIRIQSTDPLTISLVDNNYFGDPTDVQAYVAAFQTYIKSIANSLSNKGFELTSPTLEQINDTASLTEYILSTFEHTHHWLRSNRMSQDPCNGVVDSLGRVFGVNKLRIVDSSIIPLQNDGNTSAPVFLLSWIISKSIICGNKH